jgi:hypothetical protein
MHALLAELLNEWGRETLYADDDDSVFASEKPGGKKPRSGSMRVEDYLRPAAIRAGIITIESGKTYDQEGESVKRFRFHSFRHSLTPADGKQRKPAGSPGHTALDEPQHALALLP